MYFAAGHDKISPKGRDSVDEKTTLASEMYEELKKATKFREKIIYILLAVVGALVIALAGTNLYHIHQWSQFETIVVDSGEGSGNANYVQGDNTGGIFNGEGHRETEEGWQEQGSQSQGS